MEENGQSLKFGVKKLSLCTDSSISSWMLLANSFNLPEHQAHHPYHRDDSNIYQMSLLRNELI